MTPPDQLPAIIQPGDLATPADTYIVPALITDAGGDQAAWRYVEFFAANCRHQQRSHLPSLCAITAPEYPAR